MGEIADFYIYGHLGLDAEPQLPSKLDGWTRISKYRWKRDLCGWPLDFRESKGMRWCGAIFHGDVDTFVRQQEIACEQARRDGWTLHSGLHWSRTVDGDRLDYYPINRKWRWRDETSTGDIHTVVPELAASAS